MTPFSEPIRGGFIFGLEQQGTRQILLSVIDGVCVFPLMIKPGFVFRDRTGAPFVLNPDSKRIRREMKSLRKMYKDYMRGERDGIEQLCMMFEGLE